MLLAMFPKGRELSASEVVEVAPNLEHGILAPKETSGTVQPICIACLHGTDFPYQLKKGFVGVVCNVWNAGFA